MIKNELKLQIIQLLQVCLDVETTLFSDDIQLNLDSIQAIKLLVSIEEQFQIQISDEDYNFDHFKSMGTIANLLEKYNV